MGDTSNGEKGPVENLTKRCQQHFHINVPGDSFVTIFALNHKSTLQKCPEYTMFLYSVAEVEATTSPHKVEYVYHNSLE